MNPQPMMGATMHGHVRRFWRAVIWAAAGTALLSAIVFAAASSQTPDPPLHYTLTYPAAGRPTAHIRIDVPGPVAAPRTFMVPRAVPMGYGDEPYDRFVSHVTALDPQGKRIVVARGAGPRWAVGPAARIDYDVDVTRMEQEVLAATDSSRVRPRYASFLGTSVFGFVDGLETRPAVLKIEGPPGWRVYSTLAPEGGEPNADDFYALADSQVLMGPALHVEAIPVKGAPPTYLALYSEGRADPANLASISGDALGRMIDYFGTAPFPHYTVMLELLKPLSPRHGYGFGLEHMDGFHTALNEAGDASSLGVRFHIAHHVAHAWIPKRCYGDGYFPFAWSASPQIDTIWFSEGFAQYAAIVALASSEQDRQQMLDHRFRAVLRDAAPALKRKTLRDLSLVASTQYAVDFRIGQLTFSRGALMAAEMDDRIRAETHGDKSLRDALRHLIVWSAQNHRAFRVEDLPARFQEATGIDTRDILEKWLRGEPSSN